MTTTKDTTRPGTGPLNDQVMPLLHDIYKAEMAGINRYLHYSFMIMGHNRIPIQAWFRSQATESMDHATIIGEKITSYGGHPPMVAATTEETNLHTVDAILRESLQHEEATLHLYRRLVALAGEDIALEELARGFVRTETEHIDEVKKMLRSPH
ncbi:MAG: ferritin-like domain-containing protein [Candidatus Sericytochromatia bacterium]|nr:ferritin-like domain-containing protein [Candidatus Sericytochromatia bacterium]